MSTSLNITWPPSGRYILAVSGGADSMVLLDAMAAVAVERGYELVVAHFDHGLRPDSAADQQFVRAAASRYKLAYETAAAHLGRASEATARQARHHWLGQVCRRHGATAVVTAHHQDDLLETSLLNLARGTGRRGLAPMQNGAILRPLLTATRIELRAYASARHIAWREDPTNADITNSRNFLRHRLLAQATPAWRRRYIALAGRLATLNSTIDNTLQDILRVHKTSPSEFLFPHALIKNLSLSELEELIVSAALSLCPNIQLERRLVQEIALFAKTSQIHRVRPLRKGLNVLVQTEGVRVYYMGILESRSQDET